MKYAYSILALCLVLMCTSCGESCETSSLVETIIGEWKLQIEDNDGEVEFLAGGALSDPDNILIGGSIAGSQLSQKSYTVNSNTSFTVRLEETGGSLSYDFTVAEYECDKIILTLAGFTAEMKRN